MSTRFDVNSIRILIFMSIRFSDSIHFHGPLDSALGSSNVNLLWRPLAIEMLQVPSRQARWGAAGGARAMRPPKLSQRMRVRARPSPALGRLSRSLSLSSDSKAAPSCEPCQGEERGGVTVPHGGFVWAVLIIVTCHRAKQYKCLVL